MPLQKLVFKPGINKEGTNYTNEGGWFDCDKVRFRSGNAEKIGGWTRLSNNTFVGICRSLWNWATLAGANYLGLGTSKKYYIENGGAYNDVTPLRVNGAGSTTTTLTANPFSATSGSALIIVTDTVSGISPSIGDYVTFTSTTSVGGLTISGEYTVTSLVSSVAYRITASSTASSTGTGGGTVTAQYQYPIGNDVYTTSNGWGAGAWSPTNPVTLGANPFAAVSTSSTVTVTYTTHGLSNGNYVSFSGATTFAGIPAAMLNNTFVIAGVTANTFTITLPSSFTATSTTSGGGSAVIAYPQYGTRGWGDAATVGIGSQLRLWTNDNFGEDLIIAPRGGGIYYWDATTGVNVRAILLNTLSTSLGYSGQFVPNTTNQIIGSAIQRFVIAFGANPYDPTNSSTAFDPLLVRWSDQENPYEWVPAITNQSGEYRLNIGSYIVCARSTRQEILVWTDAAIYSMQYLGPPYVWGFQLLQDNISIMGPNASITVNNVTYWMGTDKFYRYTGRVETLVCTLRQYVFQDINMDQSFQVFSGSVEGYNEIWWFYCSANSTTVDRYVIYNYVDNVWYYGNMARTAWLDSGLRQYPMAANYDNRVLYHENGVDDVSGLTPVPIEAYVQSSDFDIGDGHNFGFVWRILPDLTFNGSQVETPYVTMVVKPRVNSGTPYGTPNNPIVASTQNYSSQHVYNVQQFDGQVYTRVRGRQMAYRIESDTLGVAWQMGYPRIDIRPDGRR
jgi:hypothetical protein